MPGAIFFRVAAAASLLSVVSTLVLIFVPDFFPPVAGFEDRMKLVENPAYQVRAWTYLFHPFAVFSAALALALALWKRGPGLALTGLAGFAVWATTEAAQQCLTLFAFDRWRRLWLEGDAAIRATMELRTAIYDGLWDAAYVLLVLGFTWGNVAFGLLLAKGRGLDRVLAALLGLLTILNLSILIVEFGGPEILPGLIGQWAYPAIQPLGRALIALWLWRFAQGALSGAARPNEKMKTDDNA